MLNVKEMTFEEFIEFGEKETGHKVEGQVKAILQIMFDNLKSGAWSENDLRNITDAMKADMKQRRKVDAANG